MAVKKTILMTGASGLVGSRFIEMYSDQYDIGNIDLTTGVDITNQDSIREYVIHHPADCLIHLAAYTNTAEAFKQKGDKTGLCYQVNVEGTRNIAQACKEHNIHMIHVSTDFVFDGAMQRAYTEDDMPHPIDWYGETKALAESVVAESGVSYAITRISYPYRAVCDTKPDIIAKIRAGLAEGTLPPQFTDTTMTPTLIDDIVSAFHAIVTQRNQGIFHCTGSTILSPYELASKVALMYRYDSGLVRKGSLEEYKKNNPRPIAQYAGMDNSKAVRQLGVRFASIDEGLAVIMAQQKDVK